MSRRISLGYSNKTIIIVVFAVVFLTVDLYTENSLSRRIRSGTCEYINQFADNYYEISHPKQANGSYVSNPLIFNENVKVVDSFILQQSIYIHTLKKVTLPECTFANSPTTTSPENITISATPNDAFSSEDTIYTCPIPFTHLSILTLPRFAILFCDNSKNCVTITPAKLPLASLVPKKLGAHNMIKIDDELTQLLDWIDYNYLLGVEHFFLYDNNSPMNLNSPRLKPYFDAGIVTFYQWPCTSQICGFDFWNSIQSMALRNMVVKFKYSVTWMLLMDIDEFLVPLNGNKVNDLLDKYEKANILAVRFATFLYMNNFETTPDTQINSKEPIFNQLLYCGDHADIDRTKMIIRTQRIFMMNDIHNIEGRYQPRPEILPVTEWRMNQYWLDKDPAGIGNPILDNSTQVFAERINFHRKFGRL